MNKTIAAVWHNAVRQLTDGGIMNAELEVRILLKHRLQVDDGGLFATDTRLFADDEYREFKNDIRRRLGGEPMAYIVGRREFMGLDFLTTSAALAPRPETEELTETALAHILPDKQSSALDMGAGCGAIGLSIARMRPHSRVTLADCSKDALSLAQQNAERLNARARFCLSDWFADIGGVFDFIVANPPYIADTDAALSALRFEPRLALCGGADGLRDLAAVIAGAPKKLRAGGVLLVEHGAQQAASVRQMFAAAGFCGVCCRRDLSALPRITFGVRAR